MHSLAVPHIGNELGNFIMVSRIHDGIKVREQSSFLERYEFLNDELQTRPLNFWKSQLKKSPIAKWVLTISSHYDLDGFYQSEPGKHITKNTFYPVR